MKSRHASQQPPRGRVDPRTATAVLSGAFAVLVAMMIVIALHDLGPQALHMSTHILAMNLIAPAVAVLFTGIRFVAQVRWLWLTALVQIGLLWTSHVPAIQNAIIHGPLQVVLHGGLLLAALAFWLSILTLPPAKRWHALPALLLTGKLVCLLAALLVFAPRALYGRHHAASIDDQHLAALLMLTACPLNYLIAAIVIAAELVRSTMQPAAR